MTTVKPEMALINKDITQFTKDKETLQQYLIPNRNPNPNFNPNPNTNPN